MQAVCSALLAAAAPHLESTPPHLVSDYARLAGLVKVHQPTSVSPPSPLTRTLSCLHAPASLPPAASTRIFRRFSSPRHPGAHTHNVRHKGAQGPRSSNPTEQFGLPLSSGRPAQRPRARTGICLRGSASAEGAWRVAAEPRSGADGKGEATKAPFFPQSPPSLSLFPHRHSLPPLLILTPLPLCARILPTGETKNGRGRGCARCRTADLLRSALSTGRFALFLRFLPRSLPLFFLSLLSWRRCCSAHGLFCSASSAHSVRPPRPAFPRSEAPPEKRSKPEAAPSTASTEGAASTALFGAKSQLGASATNNFLKCGGARSKQAAAGGSCVRRCCTLGGLHPSPSCRSQSPRHARAWGTSSKPGKTSWSLSGGASCAGRTGAAVVSHRRFALSVLVPDLLASPSPPPPPRSKASAEEK